jgi:pimeloyl-ACP methyl ester carboxylesterase
MHLRQLVEDVRQFLDVLRIGRVTLVGHSADGNELTHFAAVYPQRVNKLVYLDADYNYPEYGAVFAKYMPVLSFYAMLGTVEETFPSLGTNTDEATRTKLREFIDAANKAKREQAELLGEGIPSARIIFMPNTIHHLFVQRQCGR